MPSQQTGLLALSVSKPKPYKGWHKVRNCSYIRKNIITLYSEYSVHYTRLRSSDSGSAECQVRPLNQEVREIATLGSVNTKIIYSPGFILDAE